MQRNDVGSTQMSLSCVQPDFVHGCWTVKASSPSRLMSPVTMRGRIELRQWWLKIQLNLKERKALFVDEPSCGRKKNSQEQIETIKRLRNRIFHHFSAFRNGRKPHGPTCPHTLATWERIVYTPTFIRCVLLWMCMHIYSQYVGITCSPVIMCHTMILFTPPFIAAQLYTISRGEKARSLGAHVNWSGKGTLRTRVMWGRLKQTSWFFCLHPALSLRHQCGVLVLQRGKVWNIFPPLARWA